MPTLNIQGKRVKVDDSFMQLSPEQQAATVDEIAGKIGISAAQQKPPTEQAPAAPQAAAPESKGVYRGSILPFEKNLDTGEVSLAVPGLLSDVFGSAKDAVTLPGRVMSGETQMRDASGNISPGMIGESLNFATWASPATVGRSAIPQKPDGMVAAEAANRLGIKLPRGVASDNPIIQQAGKISTNVPLAGLPLRNASSRALEQIGKAADDVVKGYGAGSVATAGASAREGITNFAKVELPSAVKQRYDTVDKLITQNVLTPLGETAKAASGILSKRQNAAIPGNSRAVRMVQDALGKKDGLNYQGIKDLRTFFFDLKDDPARIAAMNADQKEVQAIYDALSKDLRNAVSRGGGEKATAAFEEANTYAAKAFQARDKLQSILGTKTSDEGVFDRIKAMAGSTSRADQNGLMLAQRAVGKDGWGEISSAVVARLGRDKENNFSADRFITDYGSLSKTGKALLFGANKELSGALEDIAAVSSRFKRLKEYANPSGTAQSLIGPGVIYSAFTSPVETVSLLVGSAAISKILSNPVSAKRLAYYSKAYEAAARNPSKATSTNLMVAAKSLASTIAGSPSAQAEITGRLSTVQKAVSGEGDAEQLMQQEGNGNSQQPRKLLPNEA